MTDSDDRIARRYREIAREEPLPAVDAAILAAARRKVGSRPGFVRWAGPVSIAAVLVLGIGVSLRMQLEKPGIETSAPENEYSLPKDADSLSKDTDTSTRSMQSGVLADLPRAFEQQKRDLVVEDKRKQNIPERQAESKPVPEPAPAPAQVPGPAPAPAPLEERVKDRRIDAVRSEEAAVVTSPQAVAPPAPPAKEAFVPAPAPAAPAASVAAAPPPASVSANAMRARPPAGMAADTASTPAARAPSEIDLGARAKKEAGADAFAYRELNKSVVAPDAERDRELERIAKLRETGKHADADRALEAFRKRYPDFRIPEAMWERVRPR